MNNRKTLVRYCIVRPIPAFSVPHCLLTTHKNHKNSVYLFEALKGFFCSHKTNIIFPLVTPFKCITNIFRNAILIIRLVKCNKNVLKP